MRHYACGVALVTARPSRTRPFARRQHRYVAYRSGVYCQYTETPAVADAVSHVVAAVVAENESTQVLGPAFR